MVDVETLHDPAARSHVLEARASDLDPDHADVVGDRQQQRTRLRVGIPGPQHGVDDQRRPLRASDVEWRAVVNDALEHRLDEDAHDGSIASVGPRANPDDERALVAYASALADAVDAALAGWVVRSVERLLLAWQGGTGSVDPRVLADARAAGEQARADVGGQVRALLALDIDEQPTTPLTLLRRAVRYPTGVLRAAGVPEVVRDARDEELFPDDVYGLAPATFADIDPALHDPGLAWGAAKAHVHLARRRAEGRRSRDR